MNGSEVFEVNVPEGNYGAVTSKSQFLNERSSKNQRRAVYSSMVAACLAFVGVLALSRSDKGHIYTSASQKMIAARKMLKSATQKLGAMESYDDSSGLLHTMYSEPGFEVVMYWKAEPSFSDLTGKITDLKSLLGKPDARTFHPALHFASYSDIAEAAGPSLPANNSADYSKFVAIFHGRMEVVNKGDYTFNLSATSPGVLYLDNKQIIVAPDGGPETSGPITLESGYHKITFIWKAPQVQYIGPDTSGMLGNVMGYHFAIDLDAKGKVEAKRNVQPGFGCLFYYLGPQDSDSSASTPTPDGPIEVSVRTITGKVFTVDLDASDTIETLREKLAEESNIAPAQQRLMYRGKVLANGYTLKDYSIQPSATIYVSLAYFSDTHDAIPSLADIENRSLFNAPDGAARFATFDYRNHDEWVEALQNENFPRKMVVMMAEGMIKIEEGGLYQFALTSNDGSSLEIDDDVIIENADADSPGEAFGEFLHPHEKTARVYLDKGWHAVRVMWQQNGTNDDYATNPTWEDALTTFPKESGDENLVGAMVGGDTVTFYVKTEKGDKIKFKLPTSTTIYDLKEKLSSSVDIPAIELALSYNGFPLTNDKTLGSYQILPESVVKMGRFWGHQVLVLQYAGPDTGSDDTFKLVHGYHETGIIGLGSIAGVQLANGESVDLGDANKYREKNPFFDYDKKWLSKNKDKKWRVYDEADWKEEIGDHVTKIIKPYTDYTKKANAYVHSTVPDEVYTHKPAYDREVVDIGGKGVPWKHKEQSGDYLKTVVGSSYKGFDHSWSKTPKSAAFGGNSDGTSGR